MSCTIKNILGKGRQALDGAAYERIPKGIHHGRISPVADAEGATAPETLRPRDRGGCDRTLESALAKGRRRDNDLRQKDRGGIV